MKHNEMDCGDGDVSMTATMECLLVAMKGL